MTKSSKIDRALAENDIIEALEISIQEAKEALDYAEDALKRLEENRTRLEEKTKRALDRYPLL